MSEQQASASMYFSSANNTEYIIILNLDLRSQFTIVPHHTTSRIAIMVQARVSPVKSSCGAGKYGSKEPTYNASKVKATSIAKGARITMLKLNKQFNVILGIMDDRGKDKTWIGRL